MHKKIIVLLATAMAMCANAFAMCGVCGSEKEGKGHKGESNMFSQISKAAATRHGVKEISYNQFMSIRNSEDKYVLLDVLSPDSYKMGHIEGALSFPLETINEDTAKNKLSKTDHIIVYCGSFQCPASTEAAKKLSGLGYEVLDYKGGLREWQGKGNKLAK